MKKLLIGGTIALGLGFCAIAVPSIQPRGSVAEAVARKPSSTYTSTVAKAKASAKAPAAKTSSCHSSYTGKCVPIASDVDCSGGEGNGPAFVKGPVKVVGPDVYGLDRDKDGWGCE